MPLRHIQIVDDDSTAAIITQRGLQTLLGNSVYVSVASSPNEAWMNCARGSIDLLIVDPNPRASLSLGLVRAIRTYKPEQPLLILTAYDTPGLRTRMRSLGVKHYVAKPIDLRDLVPLVHRALYPGSAKPSGGDLLYITA